MVDIIDIAFKLCSALALAIVGVILVKKLTLAQQGDFKKDLLIILATVFISSFINLGGAVVSYITKDKNAYLYEYEKTLEGTSIYQQKIQQFKGIKHNSDVEFVTYYKGAKIVEEPVYFYEYVRIAPPTADIDYYDRLEYKHSRIKDSKETKENNSTANTTTYELVWTVNPEKIGWTPTGEKRTVRVEKTSAKATTTSKWIGEENSDRLISEGYIRVEGSQRVEYINKNTTYTDWLTPIEWEEKQGEGYALYQTRIDEIPKDKNGDVYTPWLTYLPEGFELYDSRIIEEEISTLSSDKSRKWSELSSEEMLKEGWIPTGNKRKVVINK